MEYKKTLLMPQTTFEMKAKLSTKEPKILAHWREIDLYQQILNSKDPKNTFLLNDGPPYANGDIHTGHGLNKVVKDMILRSKHLQGYYAPFVPGWDTHGLPIETAVTESGVKRKQISVSEFRQACEDYALKQVAKQSEQFQRLGSLGDYQNPYLTLQKEYEAAQIRVFAKMALDGLIYRGLKPVYWSYSSETALAEAEIEYQDKKSPSIYLKFVVDKAFGKIKEESVSFLTWTTTPWTIPGVMAVAINPKVAYGVYQTKEYGNLVVAIELADKTFEALDVKAKLLNEYQGDDLELIEVINPINERVCPIIFGDHVTTLDGTGCVTTAPGHGLDDYNVGFAYGLPIISVVDAYGKLNEEAGKYTGLFYDDANKAIVTDLQKQGSVLKLSFITHSYPHDWRTKKPVFFRATEQWFASIEAKRQKLLSEIDDITWTPSWGHTRMYNMIKDRNDWCISRQRAWGVPLPIIYDENNEPILDKEVFEHIADMFDQHGSNIWFEAELADLLPDTYKTEHDKFMEYSRETDTMDVWFDSGISHTSVLLKRGYGYPADLYMEGSDQYRGYFNSSLITGTCIYDTAPYKAILSHGFVMDGKGNKMSKSLGNTVDPIKLVNQYGADIFRMWVASVNYQSDVRISDEMMGQVADNYRKIRNGFKFILGNLNDFKPENLVALEDLTDVDKYILIKLQKLNEMAIKAYNEYDFNYISMNVNSFITKELSSFYLDLSKDILYILKENDLRRRQVQTVLYHTLNTLNMLLAPIIPYTSEEVYGFINKDDKKASVHMEEFYHIDSIKKADDIERAYDLFMVSRDDIAKALEIAREAKVIGKSLEAKITINFKDQFKFIKDVKDLHQLYMVSDIEFIEDKKLDEYDSSYIKVEKFDGIICPRCWNVMSRERMVGDVCDRCASVLED
jgi:isoleucyl-tRNA synthetase